MVIKRDGIIAKFDIEKIYFAVLKAFKSVDKEVTEEDKKIAVEISEFIASTEKDKDVSVEIIQNIVETQLMKSNRPDVAKEYILYRNKRNIEREKNSTLIKIVAEKIIANHVQNQNANVDEHSFGGRMGEANSALMRKYALDYCVSEKVRYNHLNNLIYIHDLDHYPIGDHNCLSIPFDHLLDLGFDTRQTDIRGAQSISSALQLMAVIFQLQSLQQFGGVSSTHTDHTLVPYLRKSFYKHWIDGLIYIEEVPENVYMEFEKLKDESKNYSINLEDTDFEDYKKYPKSYKYAMDKTVKELDQSIEAMYHNLNSLQSRSGNQLPFSSINYGTCTSMEGRMIIKSLLEGSLKGIGKLHKTSIFPCGIFQVMEGVNKHEGDINYDLYRLALKSTSLRLYPNYVNVDWSVNAGYDRNDPRTYTSTMGCRTYNGYDINGLGFLKDGRGNICPVTIIMPTIAMLAKEKFDNHEDDKSLIDIFMDLLDHYIHDAKDALIERYKWICSQSPKSAKFMYDNGLMAGYDGKSIESAMKHGTLAIGQLGLAETLQILINTDHTTNKGMKLAKVIESLFSKRCKEFKEEYKLNFGVYYTPAENLCYKAMTLFKQRFGEIENVSDKKFFTNSIHVPVWKEMSPFKKIDIESQLTGYSSAGCITYVELDVSVKNNIDALETIVTYAMDKDIPYFAVNVPNDTCLDCGYCDELGEVCPICGSKKIQRLRRVTGYLTGNYTTAFNDGKQQEVELRVKHR